MALASPPLQQQQCFDPHQANIRSNFTKPVIASHGSQPTYNPVYQNQFGYQNKEMR